MTAAPIVSIVVSIYNVERYLQKSVSSLLQQSYRQLEVILVDDGSTDLSGHICDDFAQEDARVAVYHKKNGGLSDARNFGLAKATGKYVIFFDGDDFAQTDFAAVLVANAEKEQADITVCGYYVETLDTAEKLLERTAMPFLPGTYRKGEYYKIPIDNQAIGTLSYAWNKLYRREFLLQQQLIFQTGLSLIEDIEFNARALVRAEKLAFVEAPLLFYCQRPRKTLSSAQAHKNPFELRKRALYIIRGLLGAWGTDPARIELLTGEIYVNNIKSYIINLNDSQDSRKEKRQRLCAIIQTHESQQLIRGYQPQGLKDRLVHTLIRKKSSGLLLQLEQLRRA